MNQPARFRAAEIRRASKIAKAEGVRVTMQCGDMKLEISPLDTAPDTTAKSPLDLWREKRNARQA